MRQEYIDEKSDYNVTWQPAKKNSDNNKITCIEQISKIRNKYYILKFFQYLMTLNFTRNRFMCTEKKVQLVTPKISTP